jgi:hypothetical protein
MLTKILAGVIVAMLLSGGIGYFIHKRTVTRLEAQVLKLEGEKLALEIEKKAQAATIEHLERVKRVKERVTHEKQSVNEAVASGDLNRIRELYGKYRVQPAAP